LYLISREKGTTDYTDYSDCADSNDKCYAPKAQSQLVNNFFIWAKVHLDWLFNPRSNDRGYYKYT